MENAAFANPPKVDNWIQKRYHEPKRNAIKMYGGGMHQ